MYYASFGILAVILHVIINFDIIKNGKKDTSKESQYRYRQFLNSLLVFYTADFLWGILAESKIRLLAYVDTTLFFAAMALSLLLWTRYVVAFLDKSGVRASVFLGAGWTIFGFVMLHLVVNFFNPIIFEFDDEMKYIPRNGRYILLVAQIILFAVITLYSLIAAIKAKGRSRVYHSAICLSGAVMTVFIVIQSFEPFAPFYTIGLLIANCIIHVFVEEDEKREQDRITETVREESERYNQISNGLARDYEAIYYIDIESGEYIEFSASENYEAMQVPKKGEDFYKETRKNIQIFVHPDDRAFADTMYYRETMLKNLEGRRSYSYKYRVMTKDEPRYYQFTVMLSDDEKHFVLCDKDIHDTITAETALREEKRKHITFSQISESLASNYDVIYYVNLKTCEYTGYTSKNIYGELEVNESGDDFFVDAKRNILRIIHPKDRDRLTAIMDRDYMISALEGRKQFNVEYRHMIGDKIGHTRFVARKSSDGAHLIIAVENIDEEIKREKEHLQALNTEKELARRDELTGVRNKTAFSELEQSVQSNIDKGMDYLPFAIVVCDLNDLKLVNDTEGHKAGDDYIKTAAKLLCDVFDHSPVFRIGGDEFAIFLRGDDYSSRERLIEGLRRKIIENLEKHNGPVIAVGMAEYEPGSDTDITDIFDRADRLMYEDKHELKLQAG